ncbi:hypothetical protein NQZ79_g2821 [Umbelopsis isabellina]|nr:hypothetical protein NQZ79_g2821 [Umbelopsis isabellina]
MPPTALPKHSTHSYQRSLKRLLDQVLNATAPSSGWLQIVTTRQQDKAIYELLEPEGAFFTFVQKMQHQRQFSYEILPNKLRSTIQAFVNPSAFHLLPTIYSERIQIYSPEQMTYTNAASQRSMTPSQITTGPRLARTGTGSSEVKLTFSAYEFFIFNLLHGAIWNPYKPEPVRNFPHMAFPTQAFGQRPLAMQSRPAQPQPKCMIDTMYAPLLESYIAWALPSSAGGIKATKEESIFFFQVAAEVWVNETIPALVNQRVMNETLFSIAAVSKAVMQQDLRKCTSAGKFHPNADVISAAFTALKDSVYLWLKDWIANWPLEDSFVEILNIWSIWAAPWRFGDPARSEADDSTKPIEEGWGPYIANNFLFYHRLVEAILQRSSRFGYADNNPKYGYNVRSVTTGYRDNGTVRGEVRALLRLQNVLSLDGLPHLLSELEKALIATAATRPSLRNELSTESIPLYQADPALSTVLPEIRYTVSVLEGPEWSPSPLYSEYIADNKSAIDRCLIAIRQAIYLRYSMIPKSKSTATSGDSNWMTHFVATSSVNPIAHAPLSPDAASRLTKQATEMQKLAHSLGTIFNIPVAELEHLTAANAASNQPTSENSKRNQVKSLFAEVSQQIRLRGFLSSEGRKGVQEGRQKCSNLDVPALGPRAEHMVRSYELAVLVPFVVFVDRQLNKLYHRIVPETSTSTLLPSRITIRPLAAWINLVYLFVFIILWRWLFN